MVRIVRDGQVVGKGFADAYDITAAIAAAQADQESRTPQDFGHPLAKAAPEPMTITAAHRRTSLSIHTKGLPKDAFDRHVEPAGRYVIDVTSTGADHLDPAEWEAREVTFTKPLHIERGDYGDDTTSWKRRLSAHYGGKKGKALSKALAKDGYDAIVTSDKYGHDEIVDLTGLA